MKKLFFIAMMIVAGIGTANAQKSKFGVTSGFYNLGIKASNSGISASADGSGFYAGVFGDFELSESFNLQPEIHYAMAFNNGSDSKQIVLPIMLKYYVAEDFNLQAGPQLDVVLNGTPGLNSFGLGLGFGAGYDFSDKIFATGRYGLGLTNRLENAPSGVNVKFNTIQIGIGYRF